MTLTSYDIFAAGTPHSGVPVQVITAYQVHTGGTMRCDEANRGHDRNLIHINILRYFLDSFGFFDQQIVRRPRGRLVSLEIFARWIRDHHAKLACIDTGLLIIWYLIFGPVYLFILS